MEMFEAIWVCLTISYIIILWLSVRNQTEIVKLLYEIYKMLQFSNDSL